MATTEAQKAASIKYMKENMEIIQFRVKKGTKDLYKAQAEKNNMSLRAYIISLIEKDMEEQSI